MTHASPDWAVPAYDHSVLLPKRFSHALIIPVINEGARIDRQLKRIAEAAPPVDVIIADGGSTDGSLNPETLAASNVRALLVKTGPGKLSAQLRMGFAWALAEGYDGIVTVDGNGKDNVEAIASFVEKLNTGYDYVQGSRYIPGGKAINTPLDRKIAGRLIHAPLLSLAGRHCYTDTTNGYRAYSARYLRDPKVAPFRDVFSRYNLLFYLTARAGQLGYRTIEIPVTRTYPASEKTPTKISGIQGRLAMMGELIAAATGRYNP